MDWKMIFDGLVAAMGLASAGFLAYGGWICLRHIASEQARASTRKPRPAARRTPGNRAEALRQWA